MPQDVPGISASRSAHRVRPVPPPSPTTLMPYPTRYAPPNGPAARPQLLERSLTNIGSQTQTALISRSMRRRPVMLDDHSSLTRLSTLIESKNRQEVDQIVNISPVPAMITRKHERESFPHEKYSASSYLRPTKSGGSIDLENSSRLEYDIQGRICFATLTQLIAKLTADSKFYFSLSRCILNVVETAKDDKRFLSVFLMTHRTFVSSGKLFDMLVSRFRMAEPNTDVDVWRKKVQNPMQRRIIKIFKSWVEDHRLVDEEPSIVQSLMNLLGTIFVSPLMDEAVALRRIIEEMVSFYIWGCGRYKFLAETW